MSWVIVDNKTGRAVVETFNKAKADWVRLHCPTSYRVVPILEWLQGINAKKEAPHAN